MIWSTKLCDETIHLLACQSLPMPYDDESKLAVKSGINKEKKLLKKVELKAVICVIFKPLFFGAAQSKYMYIERDN